MTFVVHLAIATIVLSLLGCQEQQAPIAGSSNQSVTAADTSAQDTDSSLSIPALVTGKSDVGHRNFNSAKKILPRIFEGMEEDFYCGCKYSGKAIDLASCGYVPRKNLNRASRMEWEHVVPASHLGSQRQCWQNGGRKNCSGHDPVFDAMEGDLNNLVPSVGEVNGDRGNLSYGAWTQTPEPVYGQCASIPDFKNDRFQPRAEVRGRAGRISLYMHTRYGLQMSKQDKKLWCAWSKTYPVDVWEHSRNDRIIQWQGEGNPLVSDPQLVIKLCS